MEKQTKLMLKFIKENRVPEDLIPLEFENHMIQVLGNLAWDLPNSINDLNLADAKELFKNYLNILKRTYYVNINSTNSVLMEEIESIIAFAQHNIGEAKSVSMLSLSIIAALGELNFQTLGGMLHNTPTDYKKKKVYNRDLKLDRYYSIYYLQSESQKANLICDSIKAQAPALYGETIKIRAKLKDERFIDWIKSDERFTKIYLDLF